MDTFDDLMNQAFGGSGHFSASEIEEARRRQKKHGGTLAENLEAVTGRSLTGNRPLHADPAPGSSPYAGLGPGSVSSGRTDSPFSGFGSGDQSSGKPERPAQEGGQGNKPSGKTDSPFSGFGFGSRPSGKPDSPFSGTGSGNKPSGDGGKKADDLSGKSLSDLDREISELQQNLMKDFEMNNRLIRENAERIGGGSGIDPTLMAVGSAGEAGNALSGFSFGTEPAPFERAGISAFSGVEDAVSEKVFGQEAFIRKLTIAFKRPFVMPEEEGHARNSFFVTGPEDTGKHLALAVLTAELSKRKLLSHPGIRIIDLSYYPAAGKDNVFLQDLYTALQAKENVILFENFEACHLSSRSYLNELVSTGKCRLSERYILQKGQLVSVQSSFVAEAVSSFSAAGKYLVFISTKGVNKLADSYGAPFINALGDICASAALDEASLRKISGVKYGQLTEKAAKQLSFRLTGDPEAFLDFSMTKAERSAGLTGILKFYDDVLSALAELRLSGTYEEDAEAELAVKENHLVFTCGGQETVLQSALKKGYSGELEAVKAEMDNIVGLEKIKSYIFSLEEYYAVQKRREEEGLKSSEVSKHMIFTGNPGTGKTTIARIISRYLKAIGVLSGGQLVEVTRADLVGRFVGHTAPLTNQVLQSAIGGVLFIDEAYSLYRGNDDAFGLEAIDTLVKGIEDNRDNLIVILAGYSYEMSVFLTSNSGLKSRFPNVIEFPDYTGQELLDIAKITARSKGYTIDEGAEMPLLTYFNTVQALRAATAGNGRLVRNKVEEAILNHSRRLVVEKDADLSLLLSMDFDLSDVEG